VPTTLPLPHTNPKRKRGSERKSVLRHITLACASNVRGTATDHRPCQTFPRQAPTREPSARDWNRWPRSPQGTKASESPRRARASRAACRILGDARVPLGSGQTPAPQRPAQCPPFRDHRRRRVGWRAKINVVFRTDVGLYVRRQVRPVPHGESNEVPIHREKRPNPKQAAQNPAHSAHEKR